MVHNSCNMCTHGFPDMYTLSPRACSPRASGVHIRQSTRAHVTTITIDYMAVRWIETHAYIWFVCHVTKLFSSVHKTLVCYSYKLLSLHSAEQENHALFIKTISGNNLCLEESWKRLNYFLQSSFSNKANLLLSSHLQRLHAV